MVSYQGYNRDNPQEACAQPLFESLGYRPRPAAEHPAEVDDLSGALGGTAAELTIRTLHALADGADSMGLLMAAAASTSTKE